MLRKTSLASAVTLNFPTLPSIFDDQVENPDPPRSHRRQAPPLTVLSRASSRSEVACDTPSSGLPLPLCPSAPARAFSSWERVLMMSLVIGAVPPRIG